MAAPHRTGGHCPTCGAPHPRRGASAGAIATMLLITAAVVLGGIALMALRAADEAQAQLDAETQRVERAIERDIDRLEDDFTRRLRRELDRRLPPQPRTVLP